MTDHDANDAHAANEPTPGAHYEPLRADELKVGDYIKHHGEWCEVLGVKRDTGRVSVTIGERIHPLLFMPDVEIATVTAKVVNEPTPGANDALAGIRKRWTPVWEKVGGVYAQAREDVATLLAALDAQTERVAALERDALPMSMAMTVETQGAMIDSSSNSVSIEMSAQDYRRLLDFGVKASGQFVTFANPIPDGDDADAGRAALADATPSGGEG